MYRFAIIAAALWAVAAAANATTINFDEFTSPPVTCCYGNPVTGPLSYPDVTVTAPDGGQVMNGSGWNDNQTSGDNLFGTLTSEIDLNFTHDVSNLQLDVIDGSVADTFTLSGYDASGHWLGADTMALADFGGMGPTAANVGHFTLALSGLRFATITDTQNTDIAIDTVTFDNSDVPEPLTIALFGAGLAGFGALRRRAAR